MPSPSSSASQASPSPSPSVSTWAGVRRRRAVVASPMSGTPVAVVVGVAGVAARRRRRVGWSAFGDQRAVVAASSDAVVVVVAVAGVAEPSPSLSTWLAFETPRAVVRRVVAALGVAGTGDRVVVGVGRARDADPAAGRGGLLRVRDAGAVVAPVADAVRVTVAVLRLVAEAVVVLVELDGRRDERLALAPGARVRLGAEAGHQDTEPVVRAAPLARRAVARGRAEQRVRAGGRNGHAEPEALAGEDRERRPRAELPPTSSAGRPRRARRSRRAC